MTLKILRILKFGEKYYHLGALKSLVCWNSHRPDGVKLLSGRYKISLQSHVEWPISFMSYPGFRPLMNG